MRALEKNIKGFNLLEVLIVIVIIGFVSAVAYPNLSGWSKERKARGAAIKIKSLMEKINAQVQRGNYAFVQVFFIADATSVEVKSRGMKISTLNTKINNGADEWNTTASSRCNIVSDTYWDDDPEDVDKLEIQRIVLDEVMVNFEGESAICFSKNAKWFSGAGTFVTGAGDDIAIDERMFVCLRSSASNTCGVDEASGIPADTSEKNLFSIDWTRFGEVSIDKWSPAKTEWVLLQ